MTPVEVRFTLTGQDVAATAVYELGRSGMFRQQRTAFAAVGGVLLACAAAGVIAAGLADQGYYGWVAFASLSAGVGATFTSSAKNLPAQQLKGLTKMYAGPRYRKCFGPFVVSLQPDGIISETPYGRFRWFWPAVVEADYDSEYVYIAGGLTALAIPRTAFPDDEAVRAFVETIRSEITRTRPQ